MLWLFIVGALVALIALIVAVLAFRDGETGIGAGAVVGVLVGLVLAGTTFFYQQSVGQGVILVATGGKVVGESTDPGFHTKAPWEKKVTWDLFTRDISYSGEDEKRFEAGEIQGGSITTSVKNGAQVVYRLDATYDIDDANISDLYADFRSQDRFTRQVIHPAFTKAARSIPSGYEPIPFRGEKISEAAQAIQDRVNDELAPYGVVVTNVTLGEVKYADNVEASLNAVEEKQQQAAAAQADAAARQVQNEQKIRDAEAEAEANRIVSESLTPELLHAKQIEAYKAGTVYVVPEGSTPLVQTAPQQPQAPQQ